MERSISKRLIALLLVIFCTAVLLSQSFPAMATEATETQSPDSNAAKKEELQQQIDDLNAQYESLEQQQAAIKQQIANATTLKEQQEALKASINQQIALTLEQISILDEKIAVMADSIAEKEEELEKKQDEIDLTFQDFLQRLRVMYMNETTTDLELMFSAQSLGDLLTGIETRKRVAEFDKDLLEQLRKQKEELEQDKKELEQDQKELEEAQAEQEAMKEELAQQQATAETLAQQYANQISAAEDENAKILQAMQNAKAEMNEIFQQMQALSDMEEYVGGEFLWPLPGYTTITSYFGEQREYYANGSWQVDVHTGTDISGSAVYGKPIVAANSGKVYAATWSNYGYGNYVIIDHGGGTSTLYGHCSSLAVSQGQYVQKGDVIAYVGSTGNSTGPHLHFEVRINGSPVNAMQYFTKA